MFHVVIPARRASERLPDKALLHIGSEPMVVHVWRNSVASGALDVIVATDDEEIAAVARAAGADVALTSADHQSGTDRIAEVAAARGWPERDIVVNVQGDEPLLPAVLIGQVAELLWTRKQAQIATLGVPIQSLEEFLDPNVVKYVADESGIALYFSRAPIPHPRNETTTVPQLARRHLGLYAYRAAALKKLVQAPVAELEKLERLEQLRALHLGMHIAVTDAMENPGHGVDTIEDLDRVRKNFEASVQE